MKLIIQEKLEIEIGSIQKGIHSILNSPNLHKLNWWEHLLESDVLLKLKEIHSDSIDCVLFYLAVVNCDIFATYDEALIDKMIENEFIQGFIKNTNPSFKIWLRNLSNDPFMFMN